MVSTKINTFIENKKFYNILKIIILLFILLLIYMYFTYNINDKYSSYNLINNKYEGFANAITYPYYGNVISLKNQLNRPTYTGNQCIFELDDVYRIDTLVFFFNNASATISNYTTEKSIYIQYMDGNGNMRFMQTGSRPDSPPSIHSPQNPTITGSGTTIDQFCLKLHNTITDENGLPVYTSKIVLLIGSSNTTQNSRDTSLNINEYVDNAGYGYIASYGIFGGTRKLLTQSAYDTVAKTLRKSVSSMTNTVVDSQHNISTLTFKNINTDTNSDMKIYSIQLTTQQTPGVTVTNPAQSCFSINIKYTNTIYVSNNFNITTSYKVRSDINQIQDPSVTPPSNFVFIFLDEPIIASNLTLTINNILNYTLSIPSITVNGVLPSADDITDFKRNVNSSLNNSASEDTNICPNINDLLEKQSKTQSICDNLEFQDKVKSEKIRLERNKQYLLKLKDQQEKIEELNTVIQDLESKRSARANLTDQAKLLQYQNQKNSVSTIRDLANQRLESQDRNKLYMDLNLNYT